MRSNELTPSVTLENLPIPEEEKVRLAEIKLECESLWQKVEGLPEGLLNKQDKTYLGFLQERVHLGIDGLKQLKTQAEIHESIKKIQQIFNDFKRNYEKIMASFSQRLPELNEVLAEGGEYDAALQTEQTTEDAQVASAFTEATPPAVPKTIDELFLAAGFKDDFGEAGSKDPARESTTGDDILITNEESERKEEHGRAEVNKSISTDTVNSLVDLANLKNLNDVVIKNNGAVMSQPEDVNAAKDRVVPGLDNQLKSKESESQYVAELVGEAHKTYQQMTELINRSSLEQLRGANNAIQEAEEIFNTINSLAKEKLDQSIINTLEDLVLEFQAYGEQLESHVTGQAETDSAVEDKGPVDKEALEAEVNKDLAFYRAWQNGDPTIFSRSGWANNVDKISSDILITLAAAGYSDTEIEREKVHTIQPWIKRVKAKRRRQNPDEKWSTLRDEIINFVRQAIAGREPNEDVFIKNYETRDEAAEESEGVVSPEAAVGENAAETIPSIEEEKDLFAKAKEELVNRGLHIKFHYALVDVERHLAAVERITVDGEMPIAKKVERISQHKAALKRLLDEIAIEAFAADGTSTHATEEGLPPPTPDALTLPITAKDEVVAALRKKNPVTPIERGNALSELDSNPDLADLWRQSRREFGTLKIERHEARAAYYENEARSAMGKLRSVAKIFGLKPQLPKELQAIEERYEAARKNHAAILSQMDRVKEKFDLSTAAGKRAFARHFVLNPHLREQQLQAQVLEKVDKDAKYTAAVKNVLAGLRKYKWHTRVGTIVAVAALGAATGGAAAGGFAALTAAGRMAASTGAGALAAFVTREGMQALVEKKEEERDAARQSAEEEFSLDALEELEAKFISTDTAVTLTKKRKDVATVAAALAGGFSAGAGVTALAATEAAPTVLSEVVPHKSFDLLDRIPVKIYSLTDETNLVVSDIDFIAAKEGAFEVSGITRQLLEKQTELAINDILSAHKNMPASQVEAIVLERLQNKFGHEGWWQRADVKAISIGSISETTADVTSATSEVTSAGSAADNLDYGAINNDAGGVIANTATGGSDASTPDNLDYGALNEESGSLTSGAVAAGERAVSDNLDYGALNEATPVLAPFVYEVKSGDTLWKIMENKYADSVLKDLSAAEKNRVLDALFDKARADTALRESIGLNPRAGGDIDKLWPGDKLNTTGLEAELKKIVAGTETLPVRPRTGALPIEAERGEHSVPITNRTNTPPVYPSIQKDAPVLPAYADPVYINPVRTGVAFGAEGVQFDVPMIPELPTLAASVPNYLETTEYKNIIEGLFGGGNEFNRAVTAQVQALEASTYDFMNRVLQDFKSPYSTKLRFEYDGPQTDLTLSKMTLAEIQQLRTEYKDPFAMREFATMNGFKYETLDAWFKKIDDLKASSNLPYSNKTTLADLLGRSVAKDTLERQFNALYEAKQLAKK